MASRLLWEVKDLILDNGKVSKEEMMAAQKKKEQSMKKILNPEQYEKWLKLDKKKYKPKDGKIKANQ